MRIVSEREENVIVTVLTTDELKELAFPDTTTQVGNHNYNVVVKTWGRYGNLSYFIIPFGQIYTLSVAGSTTCYVKDSSLIWRVERT